MKIIDNEMNAVGYADLSFTLFILILCLCQYKKINNQPLVLMILFTFSEMLITVVNQAPIDRYNNPKNTPSHNFVIRTRNFHSLLPRHMT